MTIAADYFTRKGETVLQACQRLHAAGAGIEQAAIEIGFYCSTSLRKYLACRELECPWPKGYRPSRRGIGRTITDAMIKRYVKLRRLGYRSKDICEQLGCSDSALRDAIRTRCPESADVFAWRSEQEQALAALPLVKGTMSAADLAFKVNRTVNQARNYLYRLEAAGLVERQVLSERKVFWRLSPTADVETLACEMSWPLQLAARPAPLRHAQVA